MLEGTLDFAQDPHDLFTVGRLEAGDVIGVVDLLRQAPCEAAIARQPSRLLSFPLALLLKIYQDDPGFKKDLDRLKSPCEGASVLTHVLEHINPAPADRSKWILDQLHQNNRNKSTESVNLLSSLVPGSETLGREISAARRKASVESTLPLRFWRWPQPSTDIRRAISRM